MHNEEAFRLYLYAYPVIFFIFACIKGCGIAVKHRGYADAFIYKAFGAQLCCKRVYYSDLSENA